MQRDLLEGMDYFKTQDLNYAFDALTNVLNREMILTYVKHLIKEKKPFSLCLMDVDNFKHINDNYGHMTGDVVLQNFAKVISKLVGNEGVIGRYGGDEFILVLEGITEYNDVWRILHTVNKGLPKEILDPANDITITATSGVSRFPVDGKTFEEVLSTADKALYRGKMKGRNCFIIYVAAKHANIMLKTDNDTAMASTDYINKLFGFMTHKNPIKSNIKALIKFLSSSFMYEYIAIEDYDSVCYSVTHPLSKFPENFGYIPVDLYRNQMNQNGLMYVNNRRTLRQSGSNQLFDCLKEKDITSVIAVAIENNGVFYGILAANVVNTSRIWQNSDLDLLTISAKLIGMKLAEENKTLKDVFE